MLDSLRGLFEPVVTAMGYELVGVERVGASPAALIRLYIDSETGITLDDCEQVSKQISALLDVEDPIPGSYTLEVSSPGLDRPLFTPEHYQRFTGSTVKMSLIQPFAGRRRLTGKLLGIQDGSVIILVDSDEYRIPFDQVKKTRLIPRDTPNESV